MPLGFLSANLKCYLWIHEIGVLEDSYNIRIRSSMDSQISCNLKVSTANITWNNAKREYWNGWINTPDNFPCWIGNNAIFRKVFSANVGFWGSEIYAKQIRQPNQGSRFDVNSTDGFTSSARIVRTISCICILIIRNENLNLMIKDSMIRNSIIVAWTE